MAQQAPKAQDNRIHSAVYHKRDRRVNDIIRRCRKSEIISLFNIDCNMLFRVDSAHIQFDMFQNYRPYILFAGKADGVFLPASTGLLFPNACDQLDFRDDYPVEAGVTYALSDLEIATLANNGLFNGDWSCQGRIIGSVLEIPCKVDYYAVANTPITFIEIQDRLSLQTSTMKTGYKTLVAAFLPYAAQKHNEERHAELVEPGKFDRDSSEIRKRALYDINPVGFDASPSTRTMAGGASFVEVAQARIKARLAEQMSKADALGVQASGTAKEVAAAVETIRSQSSEERARTVRNAEESGARVPAATLDARLNDMMQRMVYAGAQQIPVAQPKVKAEPLAPKDTDNRTMDRPLNDPAKIGMPASPDAKGEIDRHGEAIRQAVPSARDTGEAIGKALGKTRQEKMAERRRAKAAQADAIRQGMSEAGRAEAAKGLTDRDADVKVEIVDPKTGEKQETAVGEKKNLEGDILGGEVDIDELLRQMGG